ncbi:MAG TPA: ATP-binding protein [Thermoanaerobaculia bacterium]|jgi:PAS domain S-box-containing protein|nr:ATP-binding protein [Thermoanaerobaculia bacterium]
MIAALLLEDSDWDADLLIRMLERNGIEARMERVQTREAFTAALHRPFDIILADYNLPGFNGVEALAIARGRGVDIPFIFVSGSIGEERAVEALRSGATDYVLKDRLTRLPSAVTRALEEYRERKERKSVEERLELALRASNDVIWDLSLHTRYASMSAAFKDAFGYDEREISLDAGFDRLHPEDRPQVRASMETALFSDASHWHSQFRYRRVNGEWAQVISRALVVRDGGTAVRMVGAMIDVTDRVLLEKRVEQANRIDSLGRLATTMAHEFNNVLMAVAPVGDVIVRSYSHDPRLARMSDLLVTAVSRGKAITSQVLHFSNRAEPAIGVFDARQWLMAIVPEVEALGGKRGVNVRVDSPAEPVMVRGDRDQLHQALINLAANAVDAMPDGGDLTIALSTSREGVQLRVSDTGIGIPQNALANIFEPLFTTKRNGTGLGLAVVWRIVTANGGTIDVASQQGAGTTFTITLPRSALRQIE